MGFLSSANVFILLTKYYLVIYVSQQMSAEKEW